MEFCKQFNARTQDKPGKVVPVVITVFGDKSFEFVIKTARLLFNCWKLQKEKGSGEPNRSKVGSVSWDQETMAEDKMSDLNAFSLDSDINDSRTAKVWA